MLRTRTAFSLSAGAIALAAFGLIACSPSGGGGEATAPKAAEAPKSEPAAPAAPAVLVDLDITVDGAKLKGDPEAGKKIFNQCAACHALTAGTNKVGPSLHSIIGRKAGSVEGFRYSDANKNSGKTWTEQAMYEYLENPRGVIPGTTMSFVGLRKSEDRANVIAYIQESSK